MKSRIDDGWLVYRCPGCGNLHAVPVVKGHKEPNSWEWNGSVESPTLAPSVRHFYRKDDGQEVTTCHYFIANGEIQYCGDSRHALAGKTMPLPDIDEERKTMLKDDEVKAKAKAKPEAKRQGPDWDKPIQFENGEPCEYAGMSEEEHFSDTPRMVRRLKDGLEAHQTLWYMPEDGSSPHDGYNVVNKADEAEEKK